MKKKFRAIINILIGIAIVSLFGLFLRNKTRFFVIERRQDVQEKVGGFLRKEDSGAIWSERVLTVDSTNVNYDRLWFDIDNETSLFFAFQRSDGTRSMFVFSRRLNMLALNNEWSEGKAILYASKSEMHRNEREFVGKVPRENIGELIDALDVLVEALQQVPENKLYFRKEAYNDYIQRLRWHLEGIYRIAERPRGASSPD